MKKLFKIALAFALSASAFAACDDNDADLLPPHVPFTVTDLTNVMIPEVSVTPGMTLTIPGTGFNENDTELVLHPASGGDVTPGGVSVDELLTGVTFTVPESCPVGAYAVQLTRRDGQTVSLGTLDVSDGIRLADVSANEVYSRDSWITVHGFGFYTGDLVLLSDFSETYTQETTVSKVAEDGGTIRFESPTGVTGRVTARLKRGVVTVDLADFVIGELLPELTDVAVPAVSITPGMTLQVAAQGIATSDTRLLLRKDGTDAAMEGVTLTEESFRFTIPASLAAGTYALCVNRTDNTTIELAQVELVSEVTIADAAPALEECPVNEPITVNGVGFYPGDGIRFVCAEQSVDQLVDFVFEKSADDAITGVTLTPPADFFGTAEIRVVRGAVTSRVAEVKVVDAVGNVVIPSFSIVKGQTVTIAATNVKADDVFELLPASGDAVVPAKVSSDNAGYTMTLPADIAAGTYTLRSSRTGQDLGALTVGSRIELDELTLSDDIFIKGSAHEIVFTTSSGAGAKTFAPGDRVQLIDGGSNAVVDEVVALDAANAKFTLTVPPTVEGDAVVKLVRGGLDIQLGEVSLIDEVKVGDYFKGGIVVWLDPANKAHGICMNLFHGNSTQRNAGVLHNRRTAFGHENLDHGTDGEEFMAIGMGDVCTQMIFDAERGAGYDPSEPVRDDPPHDGPAVSAARLCADLVTADKYTGVEYDDWYLPTIKLLNLVYTMRNELNVEFDKHGGESFAGTGYVYRYGPEAGQNGYDSTDGSSNYISSNQSNRELDNGLNQARFQSFTPAGASGWYNKLDPYYYVRAARKF